jgi:hypothetical protein
LREVEVLDAAGLWKADSWSDWGGVTQTWPIRLRGGESYGSVRNARVRRPFLKKLGSSGTIARDHSIILMVEHELNGR